jgi:tellurium resistance protein TerD
MEKKSLVKGQKLNLTKDDATLAVLNVNLMWKEGRGDKKVDCDAFIVVMNAGVLVDVLYFESEKVDGKPTLFGGGLVHSGDDRTGAGGELITVDLNKMKTKADKMYACVNIYNPGNKNFGMVEGAGVKFANADTPDNTIADYDLNEDYSEFNALVAADIYQHNGEWKVQALGTGVNGDINEVADFCSTL